MFMEMKKKLDIIDMDGNDCKGEVIIGHEKYDRTVTLNLESEDNSYILELALRMGCKSYIRLFKSSKSETDVYMQKVRATEINKIVWGIRMVKHGQLDSFTLSIDDGEKQPITYKFHLLNDKLTVSIGKKDMFTIVNDMVFVTVLRWV